jgi:two-component system sensor histidine kinase SaeS
VKGVRSDVRRLVLTAIVFVALLGLVIGIAAALLQPQGRDLLALAAFLLVSGGITLGLSMAMARSGLPSWVRSIRTQLLLISVLVAVLVVVNIGFVGYLMFISTHDLGLLIGLIVFSLGLSIIASLYLSRPTTVNIQEVISAVRQINAGSLQASVPVVSQDEVGELAVAFNAMVQRLQESLSRERGLEKTRRELIEAVSHDLRTPLSSIRAMIESINDGVVTDDATIKRYLHTAQSEIENLSQLVNDLFEVSQIDAGLLKLHTDSVLLQRLILETVETMTAQAASGQLSLNGQVDNELSPVKVDSTRVQRVLYNLVQNAIRHTPPDGSINIRAIDLGDAVEVQVADTGDGIPAQELTKVFERSYRSEHSRSRQYGGAGLGLSIAKGIVEAHGGRIWVNSEPGQGSVFSFTLPKVPAAKA